MCRRPRSHRGAHYDWTNVEQRPLRSWGRGSAGPREGRVEAVASGWWWEEPLAPDAPDWCAAIFVQLDAGGSPYVAEVRVVPAQDRYGAGAHAPRGVGEWNRAAPSAPLGSRTLRLVRPSDLLAHFLDFAERLRVDGHPSAELYADALPGSALDELGPVGAKDVALARIAAAYVAALRDGGPTQRARKRAAEKLGVTSKDLGGPLHQARSRGLLTSTEQGKAGGSLTPKAEAILAQRRRKD